MGVVENLSIADGLKALEALLTDVAKEGLDWNEAQTRFQIIDHLLIECLGWSRDQVEVEKPQGRSFTDYELGHPRCAIWEAKREGKVFELPANSIGALIEDLASLILVSEEAKEAITQVQEYCSARGVEIAVATNGHQLIAFIATRLDGVAPLKGKCLVIRNHEHLKDEFSTVWKYLSPAGIAERNLFRLLTGKSQRGLPNKLSTYLTPYPAPRYPSELQSSLRTISELLISDIVATPEVEHQFYEECYCESAALSQHALISKQILADRYAALFKAGENITEQVKPAIPQKGEIALTPAVVAEAMAQRPIVLVGDVGVGKSAFLKHLFHISAYEEFQTALYIYIDLGTRGTLAASLEDFVLSEIERQLLERYGVDVYERSFVNGVYNLDLKRFEKGIYGHLKTTDIGRYDEEVLKFLAAKLAAKDEHLRNSIYHIAKGRRQQVVIAVDNADQRTYEVQQQAFLISQQLASEWQATVFVVARPKTFYSSKQSGALSGYPHKVFTISPPRPDLVVGRRLKFALKLAKGQIAFRNLAGISINLTNIVILIETLLDSLSTNEALIEFISNITGGNIRSLMELVTKFIGSPNVEAEKIIRIKSETGRYIIPVHEFWKEALLGQYQHYHPETSMALNVFDIAFPDRKEHFLIPMILAYLDYDGPHREKEGFVAQEALISEMQTFGFTLEQSENALRRANNKRLIETPERFTFDEDEIGLIGEIRSAFRLTSIGAYHLKRWITEFSYLDAITADTPILDEDLVNELRPNISSHAIIHRLRRAETFRDYLTRIWRSEGMSPIYFDWEGYVKAGNESFQKVEKFIERSSEQQRKP